MTRIARLLLPGLFAAVLAACAAAAPVGGTHSTTSPARAVRMMTTPASVLRLCRRSPLLRPICPRRLPFVNYLRSEEPAYTASLCRVGQPGCAGLRWDDLEIEHTGDGSRPPIWAHVALAAGEFRHGGSTEFRWPTNRKPVTPHNGLWNAARPRALFLGRVRWGGRTGQLILAPSYPAGGMMGDHLIFYYRAHSHDYLLSLHGWEPFLQVVATLRAIVLSAQP